MSRLLAPMLALVLALVAGGCNEQRTTLAVEPAANPKPASTPAGGLNLRPAAQREIVVEPVQLKLLAGTLTLPGKVQYSEDQFAKIASPLIGRVTEVHARLGEKVIAGEVLVSLQSADIGAAYSDYMKAQSDLEFSTRSHELARELYELQALSRRDLVHAKNDMLKHQAEYRRARERLLALRVPVADLDKPLSQQHITARFDLKAPLEGTIVERNVTVGQMVDTQDLLYTIADLSVLQVIAEVYERDLSHVATGNAVSVTVEAYPSEVFPGTIMHIGDLVDPLTRTIKVRCKVTNPDLRLKPEMFARVKVDVSPGAQVLAIPKTAVFEVGGKAFVFVQSAEGAYVRRPVVVGATTGNAIEVKQGLHAGEQVVVKGALLLKGEQEKG